MPRHVIVLQVNEVAYGPFAVGVVYRPVAFFHPLVGQTLLPSQFFFRQIQTAPSLLFEPHLISLHAVTLLSLSLSPLGCPGWQIRAVISSDGRFRFARPGVRPRRSGRRRFAPGLLRCGHPQEGRGGEADPFRGERDAGVRLAELLTGSYLLHRTQRRRGVLAAPEALGVFRQRFELAGELENRGDQLSRRRYALVEELVRGAREEQAAFEEEVDLPEVGVKVPKATRFPPPAERSAGDLAARLPGRG